MSPPSRTPEAARAVESLHMTFDDNSLLPALFGRHDEHLARIEQALSVALVSRGNKLAISGAPWSAEAARLVIESLRQRLEKGLEVDSGEVDAAIRLVVQGGAGANQNHDDLAIITQQRRISPRSLIQANYLRALQDFDLVFALGPAGTGKTYLAVAMAAAMLSDGRIDRIVLSRPAVEAGENLGFLPGDMRDKVDPYLRPLYDALHDMMPNEKVRRCLENGDIEVAPLAFMRGRTLANSFVILDEAQNTSAMQMKMCLTRLGENSRMVVTGDLSQIDLPRGTPSGLRDAVDKLEGIDGITTVTFSDVDVVRHDLVTRIVRAYDKADSEKPDSGGSAT
jgi:phosphate starvation-inducible PhoH-like protein